MPNSSGSTSSSGQLRATAATYSPAVIRPGALVGLVGRTLRAAADVEPCQGATASGLLPRPGGLTGVAELGSSPGSDTHQLRRRAAHSLLKCSSEARPVPLGGPARSVCASSANQRSRYAKQNL